MLRFGNKVGFSKESHVFIGNIEAPGVITGALTGGKMGGKVGKFLGFVRLQGFSSDSSSREPFDTLKLES